SESFGQLNARAFGVDHVRNLQTAQLRHLAIIHVKVHVLAMKLLAEGLQTCQFETDVIESAAFGGKRGSIGFHEVHFAAGEKCSRELTAHAGLAAERLDIPVAKGYLIGSRQMEVMKLHRNVDGRIFG